MEDPMIRLQNVLLGALVVVLLLGLTMPVVAAETQGKVKTIDADKNQFVMTDANNKTWTFELAKDGKVTINDKEAKLSDLKADDRVSITYEKEGEKLLASAVRATRN
jgi:biopolymer transport protein ExbD